MATVTIAFSSKPILYGSCTGLLPQKPKNDIAVRVCTGHLGQEDGSAFWERPPQASSLCQALGCTRTGSSRPPGSALGLPSTGAAQEEGEAGQSWSVWGRPGHGQDPAMGRTPGEPSKVVGQEKGSGCSELSFRPQGNRATHLDELC